MDYTQWAHDNKKALAERIVKKSNAVQEEKPVAIFMSGIPGAGKTEFLEQLLLGAPSPFVRIDLDEIVTNVKGYKPEKYYAFRGAANPILESVLDKALHRKLNFALDGTFAHSSGTKNIQRALDHGFFVVFVYIYQDPIHAWEITRAREAETKRGVEKAGFIATCQDVPAKVQAALDHYKDDERFRAIGVIKDNFDNYSLVQNLKRIDDMGQKKYTKEEITDAIT